MSLRVASRSLAIGFVITLVLVAIASSVGSTGAVFSDSESLHISLQAGTWACTYTQGYWKNHPEAWPVDVIAIGVATCSQEEAIAILETPPKGDATYILAHQLIAAKLNVLNGADGSAVADSIAAADGWLAAHPIGSDPSKPEREEGIQLAETLTDYNEGRIGPGHCDDAEDPLQEPELLGLQAPTAAPTVAQMTEPTVTPTPIPVASETPTPTETETPTSTPTATATSTSTPTETLTETASVTVTSTATPMETLTETQPSAP